MPTVTGTFKDLSALPLSDLPVEIVPTAGITISVSNEIVMPIRKKIVTDTNGAFSTSLEPGSYEFDMEGVIVACTIPNQAGAVDLSDAGVITNEGESAATPTY